MAKNLREAALWELVMQATHDLQTGTPEFLTKNEAIIALDIMLSRMAEAGNKDYEYGCFVYACMISGLAYKILFDLSSDADIQKMMLESETFRNQIHAN